MVSLKKVLQAQTTSIFENINQMEIPHATITQLQYEGIITVDDLTDFDKDSLQQLADNLCHPSGRVPDPYPSAAPGATIPTPGFVFGAKSQKQLLLACDLVRYYETVSRDVIAGNMIGSMSSRTLRLSGRPCSSARRMSLWTYPKFKALLIIKWTEAFPRLPVLSHWCQEHTTCTCDMTQC